MATITPTSDSTQRADRTALLVGDKVMRSDNVSGLVVGTNFNGSPTTVYVQWSDMTSSAAETLELRLLQRRPV